MAKQASRKMIGGFVIIAVGILAASVVIFGSGDWFKESLTYVLYFQESVKGLNVGSPVLYRGFPVGSVKRVIIQADTKGLKDNVLVFVEIYPETVVFATGDLDIEQWKDRMSELIERGLRAQMVPQSLVTGKLIIELNVHTDAPAVKAPIDRNSFVANLDYEEIPTIPSTLSKLEGFMAKLNLEELNKRLISILTSADRILKNPDIDAGISELKAALTDARGLVQNVNDKVDPLADNLNGTLTDARQLVNHVDERVDPISQSLDQTLESVDTAFKSIDELAGKDSPTRAELDNTLNEIARAARSVRILAEYLEQHPEALIKGKGYKNY
jgi:paraquat-inducible protein B